MKKLILTIGIATVSASLFAQGYFVFQTASRTVWDDWSVLKNKADGSNNVAFLIGTGTPAIITAAGGKVATNALALPNNLSAATAWSDILSDPNFKVATNLATANAAIIQTSTLGAVSYNGGNPFVVSNTAAGGGSITVFLIAWNSVYSTPWDASAASSPLGWSAAFTYNYAAGPVPGPVGSPGNMNTLVSSFGVAPVPEPATMALAGLGGLSLLLFRRRKV